MYPCVQRRPNQRLPPEVRDEHPNRALYNGIFSIILVTIMATKNTNIYIIRYALTTKIDFWLYQYLNIFENITIMHLKLIY